MGEINIKKQNKYKKVGLINAEIARKKADMAPYSTLFCKTVIDSVNKKIKAGARYKDSVRK